MSRNLPSHSANGSALAHARAKSLSPERRQEIARAGGEAKSKRASAAILEALNTLTRAARILPRLVI